jgi:tetratricopeptide (TPR) repeat protein
MEQPLRSERRQLNSVFLLLGGTCLFWTVCVSISGYFGKPPPAEHAAGKSERGNKEGIEPPPLPEFLKPLEKAALAEPRNIDALNTYSESLVNEALKTSDPALLMRAVQSYSKVLEIDPRNQKALLGMATVAFENGVFDKAKVYFEKYLVLNPSDSKARTDYSLSMIQSGDSSGAEKILEEMVKENPKSFPARLSLALAQKVSGKLGESKATAEAALKNAPDEKGQQVVKDFLANLNKTEPATQLAAGVSPATAVDNFFRKHPIIGPKVEKISWPSESIVEISLTEFPMEQMPEFAKEKLKKSMAGLVSQLGIKLNIKFLAAETGKVMLDEKFG